MKTKTTPHAMLRRKITQGLTLGLALGAGWASAPALAQGAYPTKPVTLMVGFPPGGQTDFAARVISNSLAANLGQGVVIENKAGVNGNLGSADIMRSAPDGYRMLVGNGSMTVTPHVFPTLGIVDPTKFVPGGPYMPMNEMISKSFRPTSAGVGTSGSDATRLLLVTRMGRTLPDLI